MHLSTRGLQFGLPLCPFDGATGIHQISDRRVPKVFGKKRVGAAPQAIFYDEIAPVGCNGI
jgi:hypothetical protein